MKLLAHQNGKGYRKSSALALAVTGVLLSLGSLDNCNTPSNAGSGESSPVGDILISADTPESRVIRVDVIPSDPRTGLVVTIDWDGDVSRYPVEGEPLRTSQAFEMGLSARVHVRACIVGGTECVELSRHVPLGNSDCTHLNDLCSVYHFDRDVGHCLKVSVGPDNCEKGPILLSLEDDLSLTGTSLRIMTYNAGLWFWPADTKYSNSAELRASLIADAILEDGPDVVALNEAWDDDSRDVLVDRLSDDYPFYVSRLSDDNPFTATSGLMIFSRRRLGTLANATDTGPNIIEFENQGNPGKPSFNKFKAADLNGPDFMADKGVGIVSILFDNLGPLPINVAFSHMQASYGSNGVLDEFESYEDRAAELGTIRDAMERTIGPGLLASQPTFLVGDLNIDGNLFGDPRTVHDCQNGVCTELNHVEWEERFNSTDPTKPLTDVNGDFYSSRAFPPTYNAFSTPTVGTLMTDGWGFETSPLDAGGSAGGDLNCPEPDSCERIDYVVHNQPPMTAAGGPDRSLCLQHLTRGFETDSPLVRGLGESDHLPVTANFNTPAPRCSPHPRQADPLNPNPFGPGEVDFDPTNPMAPNFSDVPFTGTITNPGSMQWYVIDQPSPYSIELIGNNVGYLVYHGSDLSTPMPPWDGDCVDTTVGGITALSRFRCTFTMYDPPYYVRVFAADKPMSDPTAKEVRSLAGHNYALLFHRFLCSSDDPCPLEPAHDTTPFFWPVGQLSPNASVPADMDTMFFTFATEFANGQQPNITFLLDTNFPTSPNPFTMSLVDSTNSIVCGAPVCPGNDGFAMLVPSATGWDADSDGDGLPDRLAITQGGTLPGVGGWPSRFLVKVARAPQYTGTTGTVFMRYETSMTYFRPKSLMCKAERTWIGDDDVGGKFRHDETWVRVDIPYLFNEEDSISEAGPVGFWGRWPFDFDGSFLDSMQPELLEDVFDGDDYWLSPLNSWTIDPVPASTNTSTTVKGSFTWADHADPDCADYFYVMGYELSHERPPCRADGDCVSPFICTTAGACR